MFLLKSYRSHWKLRLRVARKSKAHWRFGLQRRSRSDYFQFMHQFFSIFSWQDWKFKSLINVQCGGGQVTVEEKSGPVQTWWVMLSVQVHHSQHSLVLFVLPVRALRCVWPHYPAGGKILLHKNCSHPFSQFVIMEARLLYSNISTLQFIRVMHPFLFVQVSDLNRRPTRCIFSLWCGGKHMWRQCFGNISQVPKEKCFWLSFVFGRISHQEQPPGSVRMFRLRSVNKWGWLVGDLWLCGFYFTFSLFLVFVGLEPH